MIIHEKKGKQFVDLDEIQIKRKIERDKGSKYFMNGKEVRAKDDKLFLVTFQLEHSPSMISQGRIGMIVTAKPSERKSVLEEAAGISEFIWEDMKQKLDLMLQKII